MIVLKLVLCVVMYPLSLSFWKPFLYHILSTFCFESHLTPNGDCYFVMYVFSVYNCISFCSQGHRKNRLKYYWPFLSKILFSLMVHYIFFFPLNLLKKKCMLQVTPIYLLAFLPTHYFVKSGKNNLPIINLRYIHKLYIVYTKYFTFIKCYFSRDFFRFINGFGMSVGQMLISSGNGCLKYRV